MQNTQKLNYSVYKRLLRTLSTKKCLAKILTHSNRYTQNIGNYYLNRVEKIMNLIQIRKNVKQKILPNTLF
jgi:hypothetical protein